MLLFGGVPTVETEENRNEYFRRFNFSWELLKVKEARDLLMGDLF